MKTETKFKETEIGLIPEDWEVELIENFCLKVTDGTHDSPKQKPEGEYYLITSKHIKNNKIEFEKAYFISEEDFNFINKRSFVSKFDVLFSMIGTVGDCYIETNDKINYAIKNLGLFKFDDKFKSLWFYYFLMSPQGKAYIESRKTGSTQQYVTLKSLRELKIPLPPLDEQKAIAKILSDLDSKIELLKEQNETLEKMGQTLFKEWFVDFEFPNEDGKPYKSSGGEMEESELGPIPRGWRVDSLTSIADFLNGLALQKYPPKGDNDLPVIKIRELKQGITPNTDYANSDFDKKYIVNNGDILFSWSGSLEVVIWNLGRGALNQHLYKVTSSKFEKWFYYHWLLYHLKEFRYIAETKATTMGHIKRENLINSKVLIPDKNTLEKMNKIMTFNIDKLIYNKLEIQSLQKTRDLLLPKLMRGEIRVKE